MFTWTEEDVEYLREIHIIEPPAEAEEESGSHLVYLALGAFAAVALGISAVLWRSL